VRTALVAFLTLAPFAVGCAHHKAMVRATPLETTTTPAAEVAHEDEVAAAAQPCGTVYAHFELDSAVILGDDEAALEGAAACLRNDRDTHITIEGNTDERGTEEYNLALGERRAVAVARYIKSLGASPAQVHTVTYGESRPECNEHSEACWAKNRRTAITPAEGKRTTIRDAVATDPSS
jgi:peptidoglycan-associated lipoprotein